jgi:hypothetical protein
MLQMKRKFVEILNIFDGNYFVIGMKFTLFFIIAMMMFVKLDAILGIVDDWKNINLNEYPLIMSHDAATGEFMPIRDAIIDAWAQTQTVGLGGQLECGARAFDYRPYYKDGILFAHHGDVIVHKKMEDSLLEVIQWTAMNPDDLVVFYVSDCEGDDGCTDAAVALLQKYNITTITSCSDLSGMTYGIALSLGNIIAVFDCVVSQYDETINCYGKDFVCYDSWPSNSSSIPWDHLKTYAKESTQNLPVTDGRLWMMQGHWQSTAETVILGTLHFSSLLRDESRSGVNLWLSETVGDFNFFKNLNLVEVDNICDYGLEIRDALLKRRDNQLVQLSN